MKESDACHRAEARFASEVFQYVEAIHLGEIQAEEEQIGRALPAEKAQRLQRIAETGDLVALASEDDLEDLARGRRGVQHHDPQLPCHTRSSFLHRACLYSAAIPFSTVSVACLPHALPISVHRTLAPAHDALTTSGQ